MTAGDSPKPLTEDRSPERWKDEGGHGMTMCVSCPECAFTMDEFHADEDGCYSCPACAEDRLEAEIARLSRLLDDQQAELDAARAERDEAQADLTDTCRHWNRAEREVAALRAALQRIERVTPDGSAEADIARVALAGGEEQA